MKKNSGQDTHEPYQVKDAVKLVQSYPSAAITVDCVIFGFEENKTESALD